MDRTPPEIPPERRAGWSEVESTRDTLFDVGVVSVTAHTVVYEDTNRRERVRDRIDLDVMWRFAFVSRLEITPRTGPSKTLTRIVRVAAKDGFEKRLQQRGFASIETRGSQSIRIGDADATVITYDAQCAVNGVRIPVEGLLVVWSTAEWYYVGGGSYPTGAPTGVDPEAVENFVTPAADRSELLSMFRAVT